MSELPDNWEQCKFGDVTQIVSGGTPSTKDPTNFVEDGGIPWITPSDLSGYNKVYISRGARNLSEKGFETSSASKLPTGSVLFSSRAPIGYVAIAANELTTNQGFKNFVLPEGLDSRFIYYYLRHAKPLAEAMATGTTFRELSGSKASQLPLLVAPFNEQKRIADKLDVLLARVDSCQTRLNRVQLILNRYRHSILVAATSGVLTEDWRAQNNGENSTNLGSFDFVDADCFSDYQFPSSWKVLRLGDVAEVTTGITKNTKMQTLSDEEVPYLRVANVQRGYLDLSDVKTIRVPQAHLDKFLLKAGDILFNEGGDIDKLGRGWVWSGELERCVFQNHVFRARLVDTNFAPKFFSYYGNSRGSEYFLTYGKQTTNLASISKAVLMALPVVVPPAEEQHEIVQRVEELFDVADRVEARCQTAQTQVKNLTPSSLSKAFRGELVSQDPSDEPVSVLLERIQIEKAAKPDTSKRISNRRKPERIKMNKETVKELINQLPNNTFSFNELRDKLTGNYNELKDIVFDLLSEPEPNIFQIFDEASQAMRFVRGNK